MLLCDPALAYDAEAGRQKAEEACAPCHGKAGISEQETVPSIGGQWNDYVVAGALSGSASGIARPR